MNRAEKIAKIVDRFGQSIEVAQSTKTTGEVLSQPVVGQFDIIETNDCWQVTFICHGAKSFFCDGVACCVFFRKDDGECEIARQVSVLKMGTSKTMRYYADKKRVLRIFNKVAGVIDWTYAYYFPE